MPDSWVYAASEFPKSKRKVQSSRGSRGRQGTDDSTAGGGQALCLNAECSPVSPAFVRGIKFAERSLCGGDTEHLGQRRALRDGSRCPCRFGGGLYDSASGRSCGFASRCTD